jgi:hypothetical protein
VRLLVAHGARVDRRSADRLRRDALGWARGLSGAAGGGDDGSGGDGDDVESPYDGPPAARAAVAAFLRPLRDQAAAATLVRWWADGPHRHNGHRPPGGDGDEARGIPGVGAPE